MFANVAPWLRQPGVVAAAWIDPLPDETGAGDLTPDLMRYGLREGDAMGAGPAGPAPIQTDCSHRRQAACRAREVTSWITGSDRERPSDRTSCAPSRANRGW